MKLTFESLAARYGRAVVCYDAGGTTVGEGKAFVQPMTEKQWQKSAGALGSFHTDHFLCLAPKGVPMGVPGDGGWLECGGQAYIPITIHDIYLGEEPSHQWAVLKRREEVAV